MALFIPDEGELELLDKCLRDALSVDETFTVGLFQNNIKPMAQAKLSDYIAKEADFTGYLRVIFSREGWSSATLVNGIATAEHSHVQTWACVEGDNLLYGYFVFGTDSQKLLWVETFSSPRHMVVDDQLSIILRFSLRGQP